MTQQAPDHGRDELVAQVTALEEELDRFRRPDARDLSTSDPITPLPTFEPQHLLGAALSFREWCHSEMWGRPEMAELRARQVETAFTLLQSDGKRIAELEAALREALAEKMRDGPISGDHWTSRARTALSKESGK
jgi:hypothetical protein